MIGMTRQDLLRPVYLLREEAPHEEVRPGGAPQRQDEIRAAADRVRQPVGPADREDDLAAGRLLKIAEQACEPGARQLPARLRSEAQPPELPSQMPLSYARF